MYFNMALLILQVSEPVDFTQIAPAQVKQPGRIGVNMFTLIFHYSETCL